MGPFILLIALGGSSLSIQGAEPSYPECSLAADRDVARLARSSVRPEVLAVSASDRGLRSLARSRVLREVRSLRVCGDDAGLRALARSRHLGALEELTVVAWGGPLEVDTVIALVSSPRLRGVRALHLVSGDSEAEKTIAGDAATALIEHLALPALRELDLSWTYLTEAQLIAIARAPWTAQLERLDLVYTALSPAIGDAFVAERTRLASLTWLSLGYGVGGGSGGDDPARLEAAYGTVFHRSWDE